MLLVLIFVIYQSVCSSNSSGDVENGQTFRDNSISSITVAERHFFPNFRNFSKTELMTVIPRQNTLNATTLHERRRHNITPLFKYCCICAQIIYAFDFENEEVCVQRCGLIYHNRCYNKSRLKIRQSRSWMYLIPNASDVEKNNVTTHQNGSFMHTCNEKREMIIKWCAITLCSMALIVILVFAIIGLLLQFSSSYNAPF